MLLSGLYMGKSLVGYDSFFDRTKKWPSPFVPNALMNQYWKRLSFSTLSLTMCDRIGHGTAPSANSLASVVS